MLESSLKDLVYTFRSIRRNPSFTAIAIITLGIGIGVNSAIFSFADALLLRPLPILRPNEIVTLRSQSPSNPGGNISHPDYVDFQHLNKTFDGLAASLNSSFGFSKTPSALPTMKVGMYVSGNFFSVYGVEPTLGRGFRLEEDTAPGRDAVVVLSDGLWKSDFAADRSVIGKKLRLNATELTIVGVAPERFTGIDLFLQPAMYVPLAMLPRLSPKTLLERRDLLALTVKGRLKPGVTIEQAQTDMGIIAQALQQSYPKTNQNRTVAILPELSVRLERYPPDTSLVKMLTALAISVLLVACANCAGLLLSRGRARSREIAVRIAIGSSRWQLIRQLLIESLLTAIGGGLMGILVAYIGVTFLSRIDSPTDSPVALHVNLDHRALAFTAGISFLSALLFGLAPALQTTRTNLVSALKAADVDRCGQRKFWGRNLLVIAQVGCSLVLITVSGLLVEGVDRQLNAGPNFRTTQLLMMSIDTALTYYTQPQTEQFFRRLMERVRSTPGVRSAALTRVIPAGPSFTSATVTPEGYQFQKGTEAVNLYSNTVDESYFETMDVKILRGRGFLQTDVTSAPAVAVVNEEFAKTYWPDQDPIGKRLHIDGPDGPWVRVVGMAKTSKYVWIGETPREFIYFPLAQHPQSRMTLIVQTEGSSAGLIPVIRDVVHQTDPNQPVFDVRTMEDFYDKRVLRAPAMIVQSIAIMAVTGLFLAMIGLYGLIAHSVTLRTREIGLRMAIGAGRNAVLHLVFMQGLRLTLTGIAVGLIGSLGAKQIASSFFTSLEPDAKIYFVTPLLLAIVSMFAALLPARRASLVDPIQALHDE